MQQEVTNIPTTVLAFDSSYRLRAIFNSVSEAAKMTGALRQSLIKAIYGDIISVKQKYWRAVPTDFQIEPDDIGVLTIFDFDAAVGQDRRIYGTKKMIKSSAMLESEYLIQKQNINN